MKTNLLLPLLLVPALSTGGCATNSGDDTLPTPSGKDDAAAETIDVGTDTKPEAIAETSDDTGALVDAAGACKSGSTQTRKCGGCGNQNRFCLPDRTWTDWTACVGELPDAECKIGEKRSDVCGNCGKKSDFCDETKCVWVEGACVGEGPCAPDTVEVSPASCDLGAVRTRKCDFKCEWGAFSSCAYPKGWLPMAKSKLSARYWNSAVWADKKMIVWGGYGSGYYADGATYEPLSDVWTAIASPPLGGRRNHAAVWNGSKMIVFGGEDGSARSDGAIYDPSTDSWTAIASSPLSGRFLPAAVWSTTTKQLVVWGGCTSVGCGAVASDGATYDPATDSWTAMSAAPPGFAGRYDMAFGWSGSELVMWGGRGVGLTTFFTDGVRYDPKTKVWTKFSSPPTTALDGRYDAAQVWGDGSLVVWGGRSSTALTTAKKNGAVYTPSVGWGVITPPTDTLFAPSAQRWAMASWVGDGKLYVFSGSGTTTSVPVGGFASYDLAKDSWAALDETGAPGNRNRARAVWTGREAIVWGGVNSDTCCTYFNDGAVYRP